MLNSNFTTLVAVALPTAELERQYYMHGFDVQKPSAPAGFEDYLPVIQSLIDASGVTEGIGYLTVDEKLLKAGETQRKPGPHVDGCYVPLVRAWGHGGGGWNHNCNIIPGRMPVIVASNFAACKAWPGQFDAEPKSDGDLSHLDLGEGVLLEPNMGYLLSPDCIHESLPMPHDVARTFIRIALPVGS